jgi:hypothetical protein
VCDYEDESLLSATSTTISANPISAPANPKIPEHLPKACLDKPQKKENNTLAGS